MFVKPTDARYEHRRHRVVLKVSKQRLNFVLIIPLP